MAVGSEEGAVGCPVMCWPFGAAECCRATGTTEEKTETQEGCPHCTCGSDELWNWFWFQEPVLLSLDWFPLLEPRHVSAPLEASL